MNIIDKIILRAKEHKRKIVLPESMDKRVLRATIKIVNENIADIILIGNKDEILKLEPNLDISKIEIIDPINFSLTDELVDKFYELRKNKGLSFEKAKELLLTDNMYFACMLVYIGYADGAVSGACHPTSNTLRPALQILKNASNTELVSAFFLMEVPDCKYGDNGIFIFADSGLVQNPTSDELATIAYSSAKSFELLIQKKPLVAFLSHSTMGSAKHELVDKVVSAVDIAKKRYSEYQMDGELQLDAAVVPEIAVEKAPNSSVAGYANTLIFPDLDSGNIGYKLVQRLAKANAYGPITQGLSKPVNDLSRGCTVDDIVGVVAITSIQVDKNGG